jgi:hypothetical protein
MVKASFRGILMILSCAGGLLAGASNLHADDGNTVLLAISFNDGRVAAGMMCNGTELRTTDSAGDPPRSRKIEMPGSGMCRRSSASILNPDVLAFDVTQWPRDAIAELASRLNLMDDPLNYDFSRVTVAERRVRRIEETQGEDSLASPVFEFSFGCYLLMKAPGISPGAGS